MPFDLVYVVLGIRKSSTYNGVTLHTIYGSGKRAVLVVNKRNVTTKFETCTQLWQILMWPGCGQ